MKDDDVIDVERLPLLGEHRMVSHTSVLTRSISLLSCWLQYQPRPIPVINKTLPSNGTSLFIALWLALNIFLHFYQLPLDPIYFVCFAARAGDIFIANLPLLYLLAAKNQPLKLLTGRSYEALNILHRRLGEWMCLEALAHAAGEVAWRFAFRPAWLRRDISVWEYLTHPIIYYGLGALAAYELLYFTSLGSFRRRWYEVFLASHVLLQVLALTFLYLHYHTARPYVLASLAIYVLDRVVWRLGLRSTTTTADLRVLPDGETVMLSADWAQHQQPPTATTSRRPTIRRGWHPADHVFISVPALGRAYTMQSHPFTIASASPSEPGRLEAGSDHHPPLRLLIRAHTGFTADLLCYAHRHRRAPVRLEGPYGSCGALDALRTADRAVLVAGGSGIAVTLPLAAALLPPARGNEATCDERGGGGRVGGAVRLLWVIHSEEHRYWVPQGEMDDLVARGLDLVIPAPTSVAGRPDVAGLVEGWIDESRIEDGSRGRQTAVVVSGPDGLNRMVRNTCARAIGRGSDVRLAVEKFGW